MIQPVQKRPSDFREETLKEFDKYWEELGRLRNRRIGQTDIANHRRAISFEEVLKLAPKLSLNPFKTLGPLLKALKCYHYPFLEQRLITPAAYRHLRWIRRKVQYCMA